MLANLTCQTWNERTNDYNDINTTVLCDLEITDTTDMDLLEEYVSEYDNSPQVDRGYNNNGGAWIAVAANDDATVQNIYRFIETI